MCMRLTKIRTEMELINLMSFLICNMIKQIWRHVLTLLPEVSKESFGETIKTARFSSYYCIANVGPALRSWQAPRQKNVINID